MSRVSVSGVSATGCRRFGVLRVFVMACISLVLLTGCPSGQKPATVSTPFAGQTLVVMSEAELGTKEAWEAETLEWEAATGADVRFEEWPADGSAPVLAEGTVVVTTFARLPERTLTQGDAGWAAIPASQLGDSQLNWMDVLPGLRESTAVRRREPTLVPISLPVNVLGYREDLLRKAGLEPPETWEEYDRLARSVGEWAPGLSVAEPWRADTRASWFLARALAYGRHPGQLAVFFDLDTLAPRIAAPPFVRALTEARQLYRTIPEGGRAMSPADCRRALVDGRAALAICAVNGDWGGDYGETPVEAAAELSLGFAPLPGSRQTFDPGRQAWVGMSGDELNRPTLVDWGGRGLGGVVAAVVPGRNKEAIDMAFQLLTSVTVATGGKTLPQPWRGVVRQSQLDSPEQFASNDWPSFVVPQVVGAAAASLGRDNVVLELPVPGREQFRDALSIALEKGLNSEIAVDELLAEVAREWERIVREVGVDTVRAAYRESLGFRPELAPIGRVDGGG
jgi:multiple sugar transport system substrate-binding protein